MVHVVVAHGTVGFSSPANEPVGLDTPLGFVHPVDGRAAFGQVMLTSPIEMIVTAYHGDLIVEENGNLHTIPEGKSYRISKDLEPPRTTERCCGPDKSGQRHEESCCNTYRGESSDRRRRCARFLGGLERALREPVPHERA